MRLLVLLVIGLPWCGALAVVIAGNRRPKAQSMLAVTFAMAAGLAALAMAPMATPAAVLRVPAGGIFGEFTFTPDGLGVLLAVIATVVGSLAVIFSVDYMRGDAQLGRYYALVLLFIGAMAGLVLTGSLLLLFLFWELVAFCSYALISFHSDDPRAVAGGIKALIITQVGGLGLLAGVLVAHAQLGSYDIGVLLDRARTMPAGPLALIAYGFLIAAAAKSAQVPFHTWLPDAMEAPTPVSALIHAATMVNAGVYLLARFAPAFAAVPGWLTVVTAVGIASAFIAALSAIIATDLKRVLAYSTISQLGTMVYAIGMGAVFASQFHLLSHAVFKALLFLGAGAVIRATGTRDLRRMGGLGREMPFVRGAFVIGALALIGVPALNGFWSKELVLEAGAGRGGPAFWLMLAATAMTAAYTTRMTTLVFYGAATDTRATHDAPAAMRVALATLAVGTAATWTLGGPLGRLLAGTLPRHALHAPSTQQIVIDILNAPLTAVILGITACGIAAWWQRKRLPWAAARLRWIPRAAASEFGFEGINAGVVRLVRSAARAAGATQTGQLNWNIAGIVLALIALMALLSARTAMGT